MSCITVSTSAEMTTTKNINVDNEDLDLGALVMDGAGGGDAGGDWVVQFIGSGTWTFHDDVGCEDADPTPTNYSLPSLSPAPTAPSMSPSMNSTSGGSIIDNFCLVSVSFSVAIESPDLIWTHFRAFENATALFIDVPRLIDFTFVESLERRRLRAGTHVLGVDHVHPAVAAAWYAAHRLLIATDVKVAFGVESDIFSAESLAESISFALIGGLNGTAAFNSFLSEILNTTVVLDASSLNVSLATSSSSYPPSSNSTNWPSLNTSSSLSMRPSALPLSVIYLFHAIRFLA